MKNSAVFICAFCDSSEENKSSQISEFKEAINADINDHQNVYFWLQVMNTYFKHISEDDQITFLKSFETFEGFNISMLLDFLKLTSELKVDEYYRVPLILSICLTLLDFVGKLQQHYYKIE